VLLIAAAVAVVSALAFGAWLLDDPAPVPSDAALLQETFAALGAIGTAAERHRGLTGAWPATLHALVPSQLSALPLDPFAGDSPLRLAPDPVRPDGLVIYSVGPDRIDQQGLPRDPVTGQGDVLYPLD